MIPNIIGFKGQEVLVHKAAIGHTGSLEHEIDYKDMNGASGHGICIHIVKTNIWKNSLLANFMDIQLLEKK